jgi:hypothetical protein
MFHVKHSEPPLNGKWPSRAPNSNPTRRLMFHVKPYLGSGVQTARAYNTDSPVAKEEAIVLNDGNVSREIFRTVATRAQRLSRALRPKPLGTLPTGQCFT